MWTVSRRLRNDMFSLFKQGDCVAAAEAAAMQLGMFRSGDEGWKKFSDFILEQDTVLDHKPLGEIASFLNTLADSNVSLGSFWSTIFDKKLNAKIAGDKTQINDLVAVISACSKVDYRPEVAVDKLVNSMMENETVWICCPKDLVEVVKVLGNCFVQNRAFFMEVSNRIVLEVDEFEESELLAILVAFSRVNLLNSDMLKIVVRKFCGDSYSSTLTMNQKILVCHVLGKLRFRSDTFFRSVCQHLESGDLSLGNLATLGVSMKMLKMDTGSTDWWDKEKDYKRIIELVEKGTDDVGEVAKLDAKELGNVSLLIGGQMKMKTTNAVMTRIQHLLVNEPLSRSHRYLAAIMDGLSRSKEQSVQGDHLRWVAEWICGNVYIVTTQDIVVINRALGKLGFKDHNYHKIWIPYYLERLDTLGKDDITSISDNFNSIGMSDSLLGGRHFFYKLGKRFQELTIAQTGNKQLNIDRKYRNLLQRLG